MVVGADHCPSRPPPPTPEAGSDPGVAAAVGGAGGGGGSGWRGGVVVAGVAALLFVEAQADVALQGGRGQPLLGEAALQEGDAGAEVGQPVDPAGDFPSAQQLEKNSKKNKHVRQQKRKRAALKARRCLTSDSEEEKWLQFLCIRW